MPPVFGMPERAWVLFLATLLAVAAPAGAQKAEDLRTVVALGAGPTAGAGPAAAREAAIADAMLRAVAAAAIERLPPERLAEGFRRVNDEVLSRPGDFVQDYRLLAEAPAGREHRVLLQVTLNERLLRERLLAAGLAAAEGAAPAAPRPILLQVEAGAALAHFVRFRRALLELPGVEGLQVREIRGVETALEVSFRGGVEDLAQRLAAMAFEAFTVSVAQAAEEGGLRVVLAPR